MQRADVGLKPTTPPAVGDTGVGACGRCGARGARLRCGACRATRLLSRRAGQRHGRRAPPDVPAGGGDDREGTPGEARRGARGHLRHGDRRERATTARRPRQLRWRRHEPGAGPPGGVDRGGAAGRQATPRDGRTAVASGKDGPSDDAAARRRARKNKKIDALAAAAVDNAPRPAQLGAPARLRPARSLGHQYARWGARATRLNDDSGGGAAGAAALPLADRYGRWNGFDSVGGSDDAPGSRDRRWCALITGTAGACPQSSTRAAGRHSRPARRPKAAAPRSGRRRRGDGRQEDGRVQARQDEWLASSRPRSTASPTRGSTSPRACHQDGRRLLARVVPNERRGTDPPGVAATSPGLIGSSKGVGRRPSAIKKTKRLKASSADRRRHRRRRRGRFCARRCPGRRVLHCEPRRGGEPAAVFRSPSDPSTSSREASD